MIGHITITNGPKKGLFFPFEKKEIWTLGNDPELADFFVDDSTIAPEQAEFQLKEGAISLSNIHPDAPCLLDGNPVEDATILQEGAVFTIGQNTFQFSTKALPKTELNSAAFDALFDDNEKAEELPQIGREETTLPPPKETTDFSSLDEDESEKTAYDTIFEDQEEEALPFNLFNDAPLILKVIAGPNAGAEIGLEKGRSYIIGKDPKKADVVFQDLSVSRHHAKLSISDEGGLYIEDLGSKNKTLVNGTTLDKGKEITGQDIVSVGTTTFLIIDREVDAQTIYAPEYSSLESLPFTKEEEKPLDDAAAKTSWKEEMIPTRYLFFAGSFALIVLVMFLSIFSTLKSKTADHVAPKKEEDILQELFASYHDLTFNYAAGSGKLFVVGHVLTPVRKDTLLYQLQDLSFIESIDESIVVDEYVAKSINEVLTENMGLKGVSLYAPKAGTFVVAGYLKTASDLENLADYLHSNFSYADRLENHVVVETNLIEEIQNLILSKGFSRVKMQMTNGLLVLGGLYDEKYASAYKELLQSVKKLPGIRSIKNLAVAASEHASRIDLSQNYQVNGFAEYDHMNYSVVINGQIITMGESINGMKITKILPQMVLLEKDGLKYKISYSR